jgi:EAL domain-containing protein (putative c-di-GMP-specific phosphodiesterase class I)/FixJ family two-component response regulator
MNQGLPRVCLIDDDVEYSEIFRQFLHLHDLPLLVMNEVNTETIQSLLSMSVLVLDLFLPQHDGIDVIRLLAEQKFKGALVLISGHDHTVLHAAQELAKIKGLQVIATFGKPLKMAIVADVIHTNLAQQPIEKSYHPPEWQPDLATLKRALSRGEFFLFYQPKYGLPKEQLCGFEALVRWQHPELGWIRPAWFLPQIASFGLMAELSDFVISAGIQQLGLWRAQGLNTSLAINISASTLYDLSQPDTLLQLCHAHHVLPEQLTFEITETEVMDEAVTALDILIRLRMKGFGLSIDDFGTGYSSLARLHRIPFTELKIDRQFVSKVEETESLAIVESCIMLAKRLGLIVVAEGVEEQHIAEKMALLGCDQGQGYWWSRPVSAQQATDLLLQSGKVIATIQEIDHDQ